MADASGRALVRERDGGAVGEQIIRSLLARIGDAALDDQGKTRALILAQTRRLNYPQSLYHISEELNSAHENRARSYDPIGSPPTGKVAAVKFDFAISYAKEDHDAAKEIADKLRLRGVGAFFDDFEKANLLGTNLYDLQEIFGNRSQFCIVLISAAYDRKSWTALEFTAAEKRARELSSRNQPYIVPVRIDDTVMLGIPEATVDFDVRQNPVDQLIEYLLEKLRSLT